MLEHDGGRPVTVYVPPGPPELVVYAGDGQLISQWGGQLGGLVFLEDATRWADALREAGAEVVMRERFGDHGGPFWRPELPLMVTWAYGH